MIGLPDPVGSVQVDLVGEFDLAKASELRGLLGSAIEGVGNPIIVNIALVTFLDSSALGELIRARNQLPAERSIVLRDMKPHVENVLKLSGLLAVFGVEG